MNSNKRSQDDKVSLECRPSKKSKSTPILEEIINSPGLHHIAEEIFLILEIKDIMTCKLVNKSWQDIVENPIFWLKISN